MKDGVTQDEFLKQIETIKKANLKKPRKNSKQKGNRTERELAEALNKRFGGGFRRVPQSGAFVGGTNFQKNSLLRQDAIDILSSDIICPPDFKWSVESKAYSADSVKIHHFLVEKSYEVGEWWSQTKEDAAKSGKNPMLVIRLDRSPRFCVIHYGVLEPYEHLFQDMLMWKRDGEKLAIIDFEQLLTRLGVDFFGI